MNKVYCLFLKFLRHYLLVVSSYVCQFLCGMLVRLVKCQMLKSLMPNCNTSFQGLVYPFFISGMRTKQNFAFSFFSTPPPPRGGEGTSSEFLVGVCRPVL